MNSPMRPPLSSIVPESAPFTAEQRVWLNGFFAGLLDGDATALSPQEASALLPGVQVGGGFGPDAALARELYRDVKAEDAPATIERMLKTYLARRASPNESFQAFARRHEIPTLTDMFAEIAP